MSVSSRPSKQGSASETVKFGVPTAVSFVCAVYDEDGDTDPQMKGKSLSYLDCDFPLDHDVDADGSPGRIVVLGDWRGREGIAIIQRLQIQHYNDVWYYWEEVKEKEEAEAPS